MKEIENEFKNKVKTVTDEKTKEALKEMATNAKKEVERIDEGKVLDEVSIINISIKYGAAFEAGIGGEVIYEILKKMNLNDLRKNSSARS